MSLSAIQRSMARPSDQCPRGEFAAEDHERQHPREAEPGSQAACPHHLRGRDRRRAGRARAAVRRRRPGRLLRRPDAAAAPAAERKFIQIDRDNFNDVMARIGPGAEPEGGQHAGRRRQQMAVDLKFNCDRGFRARPHRRAGPGAEGAARDPQQAARPDEQGGPLGRTRKPARTGAAERERAEVAVRPTRRRQGRKAEPMAGAPERPAAGAARPKPPAPACSIRSSAPPSRPSPSARRSWCARWSRRR